MTDAAAERRNPFPGLRPFRTEEHHLFFGREEQTAALLELLRTNRFIAVVGTSGSGKSSLVRAGLIPALHRGTMARAGSSWEVLLLRPGGDPIRNLARALVEADLYDAEDPESLPRLVATLSRSLYGLVEAVKQSDAVEPRTNLLVVVDQFEEVFRFRQQGLESEEAASAFVSLLLTAAHQEDQRVYVAITMRSDYIGDCSTIPGLAEAVNHGEYLIPRLLRDQKRDAIEKPVGVAGARIAPRLVQRMLNDVGDDPDQLPVLQHALMRTFDSWAANGTEAGPIDVSHLEATGGMAEALSRHADEVYASLPTDRHRSVCERAFKALTEKGADNRGIRRPTRLGRLQSIVAAEREVLSEVIEAFRGPGVTFLMPGAERELSDQTVIDLSHESLMRCWRRLRMWVESEAQSARIYRRLAETAMLWRDGKAGLFRDPDLQIAATWRDTASPTKAWAEQYGGGFGPAMEFLDQSHDAARAEARALEEARQRELEQAKALAEAERNRVLVEQRSARRLRLVVCGLAVVALVALVALYQALDARREADRNARLARTNADLAASKEEAATASAAEATRVAGELKRTLVASDYTQGVEALSAGNGALGLSHLARALRTDGEFWPAAMRAVSTLSSGRFPLETFDRLEQDKVITSYRYNEKEDLVFTTDWSADEQAGGEGSAERVVWDAATGKRLYDVAPGETFGKFQWSEGGRKYFGWYPNANEIRTFDARTGRESGPRIAMERIRDYQVRRHPEEGDLILVRYYASSTLQVWKAEGAEAATPRLARAAPSVWGFGFTPDARHVWGLHTDGAIVLWEAIGGEKAAEASTRPHQPNRGNSAYWGPRGSTLAYLSQDGKHANWWVFRSPHASASDGHAESAVTGVSGGKQDGWLDFPAEATSWFLPDGDRLCFHWVDPQTRQVQVVVHDVETREQVASFSSDGPAAGVAFVAELDRNARYLRFPLFGTVEGNRVRIRDLRSGDVFRDIITPWILGQGQPGASVVPHNRDVLFSPEGRRILTVSINNDLMLWDVFTGAPLLSEPLEHEGPVSAEFSPDGERLVTHDREQRLLQVWDTRTGRRLIEPTEQLHATEVLFTKGGERLLVWERGATSYGRQFVRQTTGRFRLLDAVQRPMLFEPLLDPTGSAATAAFTTDGATVVAVGRPRSSDPYQVMAFDHASRRLVQTIPLPQGSSLTSNAAFRVVPGGSRVLVGCSDRRARVFDVSTGALVYELAHDGAVFAVGVDSGGTRAVTGTVEGKVRAWDLSTGVPLCEPIDHGTTMINVVRLSPDGNLVASGSRDLRLRISDVSTGTAVIEPLEMDDVVPDLEFSLDGSYLAVTPFAQDAVILDVETGRVVRELPHLDRCRSACFSPDGRVLAVGTGQNLHLPVGEVALWDWQSGRTLNRPLKANGPVQQVAFSADGELLATGTILEGRGAAQVWDVASGQPLTDPVVDHAAVSTIAFHPTGSELMVAWRDGTVRVIDLPPRGGVTAPWLPRLAEAVAGQRMAPGRGGVEEVPGGELDAVRAEVAARSDPADPFLSWARWFLSNPADRTISPRSRMTTDAYLVRLRRSTRIEDFQEALQLAPSNALTFARLASVLLDDLASRESLDPRPEVDGLYRKHWERTAEWCSRRAVEVEPHNAEVWAVRSEVLDRLGEGALSQEAAARAIELGGDSRAGGASAAYLEAVALARDGKWDAADEALEKAIELAGTAGAGPREVLVGALRFLEPRMVPAGFRAIRLPDPIPGSFEDFDGAPEGGLPEGWERQSDSHNDTGGLPGRLDSVGSDALASWTVVSTDRLAGAAGYPFFGPRILTEGLHELVNGRLALPLLTGRCALAITSGRGWSEVKSLTTRDYDCAGRENVHVAFHSAYEQQAGGLGAVEYSTDEGRTWLPVVYLLDTTHVRHDGSGSVDAISTFEKRLDSLPEWIGKDGESRGGSYGAFVGAKASRELDRAVDGRRSDDRRDSKRVEVFRLPAADGQPKVRLRFTLAGRDGWYWALDDFGLYEIAEHEIAVTPELAHHASEPVALAVLALSTASGTHVDLSFNADFSFTRFVAMAAAAGQNGATETGSGEDDRARRFEAELLARHAMRLAGGEPVAGTIAAMALARAGAVDQAVAAARDSVQRSRELRAAAMSLAFVYGELGDRLEASGKDGDASVAAELAYVVQKAVTGGSDLRARERLRSAGLLAESQVILPRESEWRYFDAQSAPASDWKEPSFDDSKWFRGRARFGYGDDQATLVSFGTNPQSKCAAYYFRAEFFVEDPEEFVELRWKVQRDDGVVVYLNGVEVLRDNMPGGPIDNSTWASVPEGGDNETRFFEFERSLAALREGRNVVAAEVHQANATSSDLGFDLELEGLGGVRKATRSPSELDSIEERLAITDALRSVLWASRAGRFRRVGELDEAAVAIERALELGSGNPTVEYERALLLHDTDDAEEAYAAFVRAVRMTVGLKRETAELWGLALPEVLQLVEPMTELDAVALADVAQKATGVGPASSGLEARWLVRFSEELDANSHAARIARANALLGLGDVAAALALSIAATDEPAAPAPRREIRERREWLEVRYRSLRRLGRADEASRVLEEIARPPSRAPDLTERSIDLSDHYNASLYGSGGWHGEAHLRMLPETFRPRDGVEFDLRGLIQLDSGPFPDEVSTIGGGDLNAAYGTAYPDRVDGIRIDLKSPALHFLLAAAWDQTEGGTEVARLIVHYDDGTTADIPLVSGRDLKDWALTPLEKRIDPALIAWCGYPPWRGLMRKTWANPSSEKTISHLDFVSAKERAAPFLVAITAE